MAFHRCCYLLIVAALPVWGQPGPTQTVYDARAAFAPGFYCSSGNDVRGANGAPGPGYWQNQADYEIAATLNPDEHRIAGEVTIHYVNHSPQEPDYLWLSLDQNLDREDSRANHFDNPGKADSGQNGFQLHSVEWSQHGRWSPAVYLVNGTQMQIRLQQPLRAGGEIRLRLRYDYHLLGSGVGGRSGILATTNGPIFEVSYWYPRMCVFDDVHGWDTLPFLGQGEFYLDYGNIDYRITVPRGMIVAGAGELQNARDVLTPVELRRLEKARHSDRTVLICSPDEVRENAGPQAQQPEQVTWHFRMNHTRDVAWAASRAFIWDAARVNLPGGRSALACSFYPVESRAEDSWGRATEYLKHSVEIFSRDWFAYPYPVAVNVAGSVGGMEFPGFAFDGWKAKQKSLWSVLSHEIGHTWFPMIVGSNERRDAWMDEGFNTFVDIYASEEFNHGEYAPKRDGEYAPHGGNPAEEIVSVMRNPDLPPIMSLADSFRGPDLHPVEYFKTAFGLVMLREIVLGRERFDYAFRSYLSNWAFKHPTPADFFRAMDNAAGEDLSWFWRGWFERNWQLDQAVKSVTYVENDPKRGARITVENLGQLPMPVLVEITEAGGATHRLRLPVESWEQGGLHTFNINTTQMLISVILDPDHVLPDMNRTNNVWKPAL